MIVVFETAAPPGLNAVSRKWESVIVSKKIAGAACFSGHPSSLSGFFPGFFPSLI